MTTTTTVPTRIVSVQPKIMRYAEHINRDNAEDIAQEMNLALLERHDLEDKNQTYLLRGAYMAGMHANRAAYRQDNHIEADARLDTEMEVYDLQPDRQVEQEERWEKILEAIRMLPKENQQIVRMIYLGYEESEIAEHMHVTRSAISHRKSTIRAFLSRLCSY